MVGNHDEQREVDASVHPLLLRRPRRSHQRPRKSVHIGTLGRLDLGQIATEIADDIRAPEVDRQSPEGALMLAPWARQADDDATPRTLGVLISPGCYCLCVPCRSLSRFF